MSKSIIVLDTPSSCVMCPLSFYNDYYKEHQCRGREYYRSINDYKEQGSRTGSQNKRPEWCPLIPLPEPKDLDKYPTFSTDLRTVLQYTHDEGYNDCLSDLNGGNL
jgi:hypothetical protein